MNSPNRRKRLRATEDEKAWQAQLLWTFVVGTGVFFAALQGIFNIDSSLVSQNHSPPGRFLSATREPDSVQPMQDEAVDHQDFSSRRSFAH